MTDSTRRSRTSRRTSFAIWTCLREQADGVKGGVEAGASQLHDDEDIFYVVGRRKP